MNRSILCVAAALSWAIGTNASAQSYPVSQTTETTTTVPTETTQTTKTVQGPYGQEHSKTVNEHIVGSDGTEITKTDSYDSGNGALSATSKVKVNTPDGTSRSVERETHQPAPPQITTTTRSTTTTTQDN